MFEFWQLKKFLILDEKSFKLQTLKWPSIFSTLGPQYISTRVKLLKIVHCASIIIPNPEGFLSTHRNCYYCFPTPSSIPVLPILILLPTPWMRCGVIYVVVGKSLKRGQFLGFYAKIVIFRVFFQSLQKQLRENSFKIRWFQRLK